MPSVQNLALLVLLVAVIPLTGILLALTPWLMKGRECFAVTVPEAAQRDPRLRGFKTRYTALMLALTSVPTILAVAFFAAGLTEALVVDLAAGALLLAGASFCLMLHYRRKVSQVKRAEGWAARAQERVAVDLGADLPRPLSLKWSWLYFALAALTLAIGVVGYPSMPDTVPLHMDLAGNVDRWEPKSPTLLLFPLLMQLFIAACFMVAQGGILRSKKGADPESPVASALAYALFARAQSAFLVVAGVLTEGVFLLFTLSILDVITLQQAAMGIAAVIAPLVVGGVAIGIVYGQSGARAIRRVEQSGELRFDDDACWKLGVLYCNADDASLFVPERFGIGWTLNFARPAAWVLVVGGLVLTAALVAAVAQLL